MSSYPNQPNINPKPTRPNKVMETQKPEKFLVATLMLFLVRVRPDSRQVKPICIRITKPEQAITHIALVISTNLFSSNFEAYYKSIRLIEGILQINVKREVLVKRYPFPEVNTSHVFKE